MDDGCVQNQHDTDDCAQLFRGCRIFRLIICTYKSVTVFEPVDGWLKAGDCTDVWHLPLIHIIRPKSSARPL